MRLEAAILVVELDVRLRAVGIAGRDRHPVGTQKDHRVLQTAVVGHFQPLLVQFVFVAHLGVLVGVDLGRRGGFALIDEMAAQRAPLFGLERRADQQHGDRDCKFRIPHAY